jgi:hypothetical protein
MRELVNRLAAVSCIRQIHVYLTEGMHGVAESFGGYSGRIKMRPVGMQTQKVLEPLRALYAVGKVDIRGVSEEYVEVLSKSMTV